MIRISLKGLYYSDLIITFHPKSVVTTYIYIYVVNCNLRLPAHLFTKIHIPGDRNQFSV